MSTEIEDRLVNRLHKLLKTDFWIEFMRAIAKEFEYLEADIEYKKNFNVISEQNSDRLLQIASKFGYDPNLVLFNDEDYLREEVRSITYRIKNKSTLNGYLIAFKKSGLDGQLFSIFYDGMKLIRDIDFDTTLEELGLHIGGTPFLGVTPTIYPAYFLNLTIGLDDDLELDSDPTWYLDQGLVKKSTQHLAIEYKSDKLYTLEGEEYMFLPDYCFYLHQEVNYNRETTTIPHPGVNISFITDQTGYFNSNNRSSDYTIDILKTQTAITNTYRSKLQEIEEVILDDGRELDETITWSLDQVASQSSIDPTTFFYLVAGDGLKKGQLDFNIGRLYDEKTIHYGFDEYLTDNVYDSSLNTYDATVDGDFDRITGIIGKTVNFDGATSVSADTSTIIVSNDPKTLQFWIKVDSVTSGLYYIINHEYISCWIDQSTDKFHVSITGGSGTEAFSIDFTPDNLEHIVHIELDTDTSLCNLFLDTVLEFSQDITAIGVVTGTYPLHIGFDGTTNYFTGLIDDFLSVERIFNDEEKTYIYENKLGQLKRLSNIVYRDELSVNQIYSNDDYFVIQGIISGNTIKNRYLAIADGFSTTYSGDVQSTAIIAGTVKITYTDFVDVSKTLTDDGTGNLLNDFAVGTIDYSTGDYSFTTLREYTILKENSLEGVIVSENYDTKSNVKPYSVAIEYNIAGTTYIATDDGVGNITGTSIDSASIDYETGIITLNFSVPTDDYIIWTSYTYIKEDLIKENTEITVEFGVNRDIEITEIGIENNNRELLIYSTTPPFKMGTTDCHIGVQFFIAKT
jgi:hypothetical protein